jgi:nitroreductase
MLRDLVRTCRSYRRFHEDHAIDESTLRELVDLARLSASAANVQPLKYLLSCAQDLNAVIFQHVAWAGYLEDWPGPAEGERPAAYIIILGDTSIAKHFHCDHGIAAQSIMLGAAERGLGGCMMGSVQREKLQVALSIPGHLHILLVLALGKPAEEVVIETVGEDGNIRYWRDEQGVHHVPKRALDEIVVQS